MERVRDRNRIAFATEHQRGTPGDGEAHCSECMIDRSYAIPAPSEEPPEELAQFNRARALRDKDRPADADLDAGCEHNLATRHAVLPQSLWRSAVANPPMLALADQLRVD